MLHQLLFFFCWNTFLVHRSSCMRRASTPRVCLVLRVLPLSFDLSRRFARSHPSASRFSGEYGALWMSIVGCFQSQSRSVVGKRWELGIHPGDGPLSRRSSRARSPCRRLKRGEEGCGGRRANTTNMNDPFLDPIAKKKQECLFQLRLIVEGTPACMCCGISNGK